MAARNIINTLFTLLMILGLGTGCSHQYREADPQISSQEVYSTLDSIRNEMVAMGASGGATAQFFEMSNTAGGTLYFSDGPGPLGPVISVASLVDFSFLGQGFENVYFDDIEKVHIFFVDLPFDSGHDCGLLIDIKLKSSGQFVSHAFVSGAPGQVIDGEFAVELQDDAGARIVLRSRDLVGGSDLKNVIQLRMSLFDMFGNELDNGKFSTLVGFGT